MREHPEWPREEDAAQIGRSLGWVKKWLKRLRETRPDDEAVLWGHSRARKHPPRSTSPEAIERILDIRDHPPDHLQRPPGPKAILSSLHQPQERQETEVPYPRSTRTIWRMLSEHDRIRHRGRRQRVPIERPAPMTAWQLDFKAASTVPPDPDGKQQQGVEILNTGDRGTAILRASQVGEDFNAETVLPAVVETVRTYGLRDAGLD